MCGKSVSHKKNKERKEGGGRYGAKRHESDNECELHREERECDTCKHNTPSPRNPAEKEVFTEKHGNTRTCDDECEPGEWGREEKKEKREKNDYIQNTIYRDTVAEYEPEERLANRKNRHKRDNNTKRHIKRGSRVGCDIHSPRRKDSRYPECRAYRAALPRFGEVKTQKPSSEEDE